MFKKLLKSKLVLYLVTLFALFNVVGYLLRKDIESVTFFVASGYLSSYFSKNMIVNLLTACLATNILIFKSFEGMENAEEEESDEEETLKEAISKKKKRKKKQKGGGEDDEEGMVDRIDAAATLAETYRNLEGVLGPTGMRSLAKDTKNLVKQQEGLMNSVKQMQPMMKQLGGMVQSFGGVDGINKMMSSLKGMSGAPSAAGNSGGVDTLKGMTPAKVK